MGKEKTGKMGISPNGKIFNADRAYSRGLISGRERQQARKKYGREYVRFGKKYRKIGRDEIIQEGAMHSVLGDELSPILDPGIIGEKPSDLNDEIDFFNPLD
uniref:Uncharacterized protein n=1 Tax=viral metagenome TaxID=1070528 RepID=A0A6M3LDM0_9ZZZZ